MLYCDDVLESDMKFEEDDDDYSKIIKLKTENEGALENMPMEALKLFGDFDVCVCARTKEEESNHVNIASEEEGSHYAAKNEENFEDADEKDANQNAIINGVGELVEESEFGTMFGKKRFLE
jgi:hypothetical protein